MKNAIELIEEGKVKRYFRARQKPSFEGAVTHVTQHATGKEPLFIEESDYLYMLHLMKEKSKKFRFNILSFVLMPNHIHLLIKLSVANLSIAMKKLFESYAVSFNKKYNRKGHVFCGPYRSALCFDESYLLAASLYIHLNPPRANLVKNPIDYRWSSCALFLKEIRSHTFIDYKFVLTVLDRDLSESRLKYGSLLQSLNIKKMGNVLEEPRALEGVVLDLRGKLLDFYKKEKDKRWLENHGLLGDGDIDKKIADLKKKQRLKEPQDIVARKFLIEHLKARGYSISDISERLNLSRQSIYNTLLT